MSEHPLASHAVGEVAGDILERLGPGVDLAVVFATGDLTGPLEDVVPALATLLDTETVIGTTACGVLGGPREIEDGSALSVMAFRGFDAELVRFDPGARDPDGGWERHDDDTELVLLADPFSSPVTEIIDSAHAAGVRCAMHGGLASAATAPGGNRLIAGRRLHADGAVGVALHGATVESAVSQGCRPVAQPLTITGAVGNVITELASEPPLPLLRRLAEQVSPRDRERMAEALHVGIVIDESNSEEFATGDFLIRGLLGADPDTGAIAVGAHVEIGSTIQFHVRDAETATADLHQTLAEVHGAAALVFTCNGRGERLFGAPGHDAETIAELTGVNALSGMFCAGEIGPVGGQNHVHGFTASSLVFSG